MLGTYPFDGRTLMLFGTKCILPSCQRLSQDACKRLANESRLRPLQSLAIELRGEK